MQYQRMVMPIDGFSDSTPYRVSTPTIAQEVLNCAPRDAWRDRRRIGTRQGFVAIEDMPANIQWMSEVKDYTSGTLSQYVIVIAGGIGYKLDTNGRTTFGASTAVRPIGSTTEIEGVQFGNYVYLVNGKDYFRINLSNATLVIENWVSAGHNYGQNGIGPDINVVSSSIALGTAGSCADKIAVFGARIVLAGIGDSPTNWFMSAVGDANDWDATVGSGLTPNAIAGGSTDEYGTLGEPIKAIFPLGDTGFMFGCTNSLVYLNGDPQFTDSRLRVMSKSVGVAGKRSWCPGPEKTAMVAFTDGVYRVAPNDFDVDRSDRVTADRLDGFFSGTDFEDVNMVMAFDDYRRLVYLYVNRTDSPQTSTHFACDVDRFSWWPMTIEDTLMPVVTSTTRFRPLLDDRPVLWLGGLSRISVQPADGVYAVDGCPLPSSPYNPSDNKRAFASTLLMGPVNLTPDRRVLLTDARVVMAADSQQDKYDQLGFGPQLTVVRGASAQEAIGTSSDVIVTYGLELRFNPADDDNDAATTVWDTTVSGGTAGTPATDRAIGGFAPLPTGRYSPTDTAVPGTDQSYAGPGPYSLTYDSSGADWEIKGPGDDGVSQIVFYEQVEGSRNPAGEYEAVPGFTAQASVLAESALYTGRQVAIERPLRRGINESIRMRVRAPDIYLGIDAVGRTWAIEDISILVQDGGPHRQGYTDEASNIVGRP